MSEQILDRLGAQAAEYMERGAAEYLKRHRILEPDIEAVVAALRVAAPAALTEAMADAREAINAGMIEYAAPLFRTTMITAGIQAVKALYPPPQQPERESVVLDQGPQNGISTAHIVYP